MMMRLLSCPKRMPSISLLRVLLLFVAIGTSKKHTFALGFRTGVKLPSRTCHTPIITTQSSPASLYERRKSRSILFMSDVPQDNESQKKTKGRTKVDDSSTNNNKNNSSKNNIRRNLIQVDHWWKLPPPPEDQFVLIGDLLSLAVYGITDHLVCQTMSHSMVPADHAQVISDMVVSADSALHAPVWWEATSPQAGTVLQATMESHLVTHYSPLLEPMGQATTLLAAAWVLAGWFHRAFLFQNTLDCSTEKVLTVTARTWLTTCFMLFALVTTSQAIMGVEDWATNFQRGDVDYIVDSLTVLIVWRFMASQMLGGGSK